MSHASNKVKWCLNKAKRELEEWKKHRGLVEAEPNKEEAKKHTLKAEHNLKAIIYFESGGFSDWSISASFYCMYHCFLAIILKFGYESRNQECTIALIEHLKEQGKIDLDDKFIESIKSHDNFEEKHESNIIDLREDFQYGTETKIEETEKLKEITEMCKELIEITKEIVLAKS